MTQIVSVSFPPADRLLGVAADVGVAYQRGPWTGILNFTSGNLKRGVLTLSVCVCVCMSVCLCVCVCVCVGY